MSWFKVDDGLHDHRKVRKVRKSHTDKRRDVAPLGLWVLAGSYAGDNGTDGFVPTEELEDWDDDAVTLAERLVDAGLWWHDEVEGETGYRFHDWADKNPTDNPSDPRVSGAYGNHIRWHVKREQTDPECSFCNPDDRPDIGAISPPDITRNRSRPVPTRPDPTHKEGDNGFDRFWSTYPKRVGKGQARKAWAGALKKATPDTIIEAASNYAIKVGNTEPRFIANPATWLNGERWTDEEPTTGPRNDAEGRLILPPLPSRDPWGPA